MDFERLIKKRASIRHYSTIKKPKIELVIEAIESANHAPTPGNIAILKYLIIEDKEKIEKIAQACLQPFIAKAPIVVVVCSDSKDSNKLYKERSYNYVKQHAGAAIENFLLKITELGLASCWIGAFSDMMIRSILKIPDEIDIEAILPVAYSSVTDKTIQRKKPSLENRIFFETWKNKLRKQFVKIQRDIE